MSSGLKPGLASRTPFLEKLYLLVLQSSIMKSKNLVMRVADAYIAVISINDEDYISLTDMIKHFGDEAMLYNWLRNRNTVEFLGIWEALHNPGFKPVEFDRFRREAGLNSFKLSPQKWIKNTSAIGIKSKSGRYGGTYAHRDIAFEFGAWLSPEFKLLLIKEFQRLKKEELRKDNLEWNYQRYLSKVNYRIHTDSIKENLIPSLNFSKDKEWLAYAEEADLLNMALFNQTASEWRQRNPIKAKNGENIRDHATIEQLTVLSNLESINALFIFEKISKEERFLKLRIVAHNQMKSLLERMKNSPDVFTKNHQRLNTPPNDEFTNN